MEPLCPQALRCLAGLCQSNQLADLLNQCCAQLGYGTSTIASCEIERLYPQKDGGFSLLLTLCCRQDNGPTEHTLLAEWVGANAECESTFIRQRLQKKRRSQLGSRQGRESIIALPSVGLVVRKPGFDERIPGLRLLHDPAARRMAMSSVLAGEIPSPSAVSASLLSHRLGKRCVVRYELEPGTCDAGKSSLIAKSYKQRSNRGATSYKLMQHLLRALPTSISTPAGWDAHYNTLWMKCVPGQPLSDLSALQKENALRQSATLLQALHQVTVPGLRHYNVLEELSTLRRWIQIVGVIRPALKRRLSLAYAAVSGRLLHSPAGASCLIHRDFFDKQLIATRNGVVLLDFDTACYGDPMLDVGNMQAHLMLDAAIKNDSRDQLGTQFLQDYSDSPLFHEQRAKDWLDAALLRLVCINACHSKWQPIADFLLEEIEHGTLTS